jgi:peptidoglycan/xylan/chitin deacetylase (PgdA/CDA1 family)
MNALLRSQPPTLSKAGTTQVPVLMYHSIATHAAPRFRKFVVRPEVFAAQMDYLSAEGYGTLTAVELARYRSAGQPPPSRTVVLTFDDGYTDFADTALPILSDHGFRASIYVPTGYVGTTARWLNSCGEADRPVLSWQALSDIATEGVEVAAHSHSHPQLDRIPGAAVEDEVRRCKALLEDRLGKPAHGFAYPFGYWNRRVRAIVARAGFRYGCAVDEHTSDADDGLLALPRLTVSGNLGVAELARLLRVESNARLRFAASRSRAERTAWLALRRGLPAVGGDPRAGWRQ